MRRLAKFDVSRSFSQPLPRVLAQCLFGAACAALAIGVRSLVDIVAPTAGPFALVYPTVLLATLYGHWRAGLVAYCVSFLWAWYFVLPDVNSFHFMLETDPPRVAINAVTALVVLVFAESFRDAVTQSMGQCDAEIARRTLLLQELDHRTKNNFALVLSLLELQKRKEDDPRISAALDLTGARIHSFARAYSSLAEIQGEGGTVEVAPYIRDVVTRFSRSAFPENITVGCKAAECALPREVAVAIGLFINEALTNCAKYAFPDGRTGRVDVRFDGDRERWSLKVWDNGIGGKHGEEVRSSSGLGTTLMRAFADQARAEYHLEASPAGRSLTLTSS